MSSRRLSLSLVVLPPEVNVDIAGHLVATSERAIDDLRGGRPTRRCVACSRMWLLVSV
jgi:hypothetical protein